MPIRGADFGADEAHRELGDAAAKRLWQLTERHVSRLAELAGDAFRPVGSLRLARTRPSGTSSRQSTKRCARTASRRTGSTSSGLPRITHPWAGLFGTTVDRLPLVGPVPDRDGVWVAAGYSGHGNVMGLAGGGLVAQAILGRPPPELKLFDPARLIPS